MPAPRLSEATAVLIRDYIKANISTALGAVRLDRADSKVQMTDPRSYFLYAPAKGYQAPAVFVICDDFDFRTADFKANFIDAVARVNVSVVVEDREKELLTYKTWRYQSAFHQLLAQTELTSIDNKVKLTVVVKRASFSPMYSSASDKNSTESVFRKEVLLECDVFHRENY